MDSHVRKLLNQYRQSGDGALVGPLLSGLARLHPQHNIDQLVGAYGLAPADAWDYLNNFTVGMTSSAVALINQEIISAGYGQIFSDSHGTYPAAQVLNDCLFAGDPEHTGLTHPTVKYCQLAFQTIWKFNMVPQMPLNQIIRCEPTLSYEQNPNSPGAYLVWGSIPVREYICSPSARVYFEPARMTPEYARLILTASYQIAIAVSMGSWGATYYHNYQYVHPPGFD